MDSETFSILLIEDDATYAHAVQESILRFGSRQSLHQPLTVIWAHDLTEGLAHLERGASEAVLLDSVAARLARHRQRAPHSPSAARRAGHRLDRPGRRRAEHARAQAGAEDYLLKGEVNGRAWFALCAMRSSATASRRCFATWR